MWSSRRRPSTSPHTTAARSNASLLERSYHVATQDYDKELIFEATVAFAHRVTA
jgi:hypothetical protein